MQVVLTLVIDIGFDLESNGKVYPESAVPAQRVAAALEDKLHESLENSGVLDDLVEAATDSSGWCVSSLGIDTKLESTCLSKDQ